MSDNVSLRKFNEFDIENKVKWINDEKNNKYLHYELPLEVEKTKTWYMNNKDREDRYDAIIEYKGVAVGVIGLLSINEENAEYYVTLGEEKYKGMGIAKSATEQLLEFAFFKLNLKEVFLYTEVENKRAQQLFEKCGFEKCGLEKKSARNRGVMVDRFFYKINKKQFEGLK